MNTFLTQIWVNFLGVPLEVREDKVTHCLKLVNIMLET